MILSPSILNVEDNKKVMYIKELEKNGVTFLHLDVMDGKFVPNQTFDYEYIKTLRKESNMIFDTHLMIEEPENLIEEYINSGSDYITFHIEATKYPLEIINKIKQHNKKVGISIKPNTSVSEILKYLPLIDLVLVMSVEPGFGGQSFMENSLPKINELKTLKETNNYSYLIEVDGGINNKTASLVKEAGVEAIVVGSYLTKQENLEKAIYELTNI